VRGPVAAVHRQDVGAGAAQPPQRGVERLRGGGLEEQPVVAEEPRQRAGRPRVAPVAPRPWIADDADPRHARARASRPPVPGRPRGAADPAQRRNVARTCAVTGSGLHLVGPLGFGLSDKALRRAGLDYWSDVAPQVYHDWRDFEARALCGAAGALHLFTARAERSALSAQYAPGDFLVFGQEQLGLPPALLAAHPERCMGLPVVPGARSLNLAAAVGAAVYQALRCLVG
jgi:tRNA (cytidine/uridine-2'-O-)-methyltransferase